ncbi:hypothetical protein VNO78_19248 [Psophocarpus tetragonolobus]|uniref:Uncharacterized protein n=1 Tax=Psophocarpus tetragonolobus TaxID=3891 RepID=A0AAN9XG47_PSOTE
MFILGVSICMGLSIPQYFNKLLSGHGPVHTSSTAFNNTVQVIFSSQTTVAVIVAYFLDLIRDSGRHWWEKFRKEFYSLPLSLSKPFPSQYEIYLFQDNLFLKAPTQIDERLMKYNI